MKEHKEAMLVALTLVALILIGCSQPQSTSTAVPITTLPTIAPTRMPIEPLFDQSTLTRDDQVIGADRVVTAPQYTHAVGSRRFVVQDNTVSELDSLTDEKLWLIASPEGATLRWLDAEDQVAYLSSNDDTVLRLDLDTRDWLPPLGSPVDERFAEHDASVIAALCNRPYLFVLSLITDYENVVSYRITGYDQRSGDLVWTRTF